MLALMFVLSQALVEASPEPVSGKDCTFGGMCATEGDCRRIGPFCSVELPNCDHSGVCAEWGDCIKRGNACVSGDAPECGPGLAACDVYGHCKPFKSSYDGRTSCAATPTSCAGKPVCLRQGACAYDRTAGTVPLCVPSAKGCRESAECTINGRCGFDAKRKLCVPDTMAHCQASYECRDIGMCVQRGDICRHMGSADCRGSNVCAVFGACAYGPVPCGYSDDPSCKGTSCMAPDDAPCAASEGCKRFGACTADDGTCVVSTTIDPCEVERVSVTAVVATSTREGLGGFTFEAAHLLDRDPRTGWLPAVVPTLDAPVRLSVDLAADTRVVGIELANGIGGIDRVLGRLSERFTFARGIVVRAGDKPLAFFAATANYKLQVQRFAPVTTRHLDLDLIDAYVPRDTPLPGITELAILRCRARE